MIISLFTSIGGFCLEIIGIWACLEVLSWWTWNTWWMSERRIQRIMVRAAKRARRSPSWFVGLVVGVVTAFLWGDGPSTLGLSALLSRPLPWIGVGLCCTLFLWIGAYKVVGMMVFFIPGHKRVLSAITTFIVVKWGCFVTVLLSYSAWLVYQLSVGVLSISKAISTFVGMVKNIL